MKVRVVDSLPLWEQIADRLASAGKMLALDTETTGFSPLTNRLVAVQLATKEGQVVIVDWRKATPEWALPLQRVVQSCPVIGHNLNFDWKFLKAGGVTLGKLHDTQVAEQVIRAKPPKGITLKALTEQYIGREMSKEERNWFIDLDTRPDEWDAPFPAEQINYMGEDVRWLHSILSEQCGRLKAEGLIDVYKLEMRVLPAIAQMELNGVYVDVDGWRAVIREQEALAREKESECITVFGPPILAWRQERFDAEWEVYSAWERARDEALADFRLDWLERGEKKGWGEFKTARMKEWREANESPGKPKLDESPPNIGSSQQLLVAFKALGIPATSAEADGLERLLPKHPELQPLMDFKKAEKIVSTYGESLLERIESDSRIHPSFSQIGAETGRMSSSKPNWQNIPARTEVGKRLRNCVVAAPGHVLLVGDFSIIELRILANMSGCRSMLDMFASGVDLHTYTARKMFGLSDDMTDDEVKAYKLPNGLKARDVAKTINYGVAYGQSAFGFSLKFGVDKETAQGFIDKWYEAYPDARKWLDKAGRAAVRFGYSKTITGRKRYYSVTSDSTEKEIGAVRRAGMNAPIQGTSADITKEAVARFYEGAGPWFGRLIAVVHDELVVEAEEHCAEQAREYLSAAMNDAARHFLKRVVVPDADVHVGARWEH